MTFSRYSADLLERRRASGAALVVLRTVGSTQSLARRIVDLHRDEGSEVPRVDIVAWEQSVGRGRDGRGWESPGGSGVWATLVRPVARSGLRGLPVRLATSLGEVLRARLGDEVGIKWPNDLLLGGRKLGGLLIDVVGPGGAELVTAVAGLGVNVDAVPAPGSTSFRERGVEVDPAELAAELLEAASTALESAAPALERFRQLLVHRPGENLRCRLAPGGDPVEGRFVGLDPDGNLRLEVGGTTRVLAAAEILGAAG